MPGFAPGRSTADIASQLGTPERSVASRIVDQLSPREANDAEANTYSGLFGFGDFPLHTDFAHWPHPPRYLLLRCIIGFEAVTTPVVDGAAVATQAGEASLMFGLVRPRRRQNGELPLLSILERRPTSNIIRWDEVFIRPASRAGNEAVERFRSIVSDAPRKHIALAFPGDTLFIDNWRMLHGRSPIPDDCQSRLIERSYLEDLH